VSYDSVRGARGRSVRIAIQGLGLCLDNAFALIEVPADTGCEALPWQAQTALE
jgi:hypothetical protein